MANLTSTLDIRLIDDVSKSAQAIDAALQKMASEAKAVDHALSQGGASDKLAQGLRKIGASVPAIEGATKAMREYAQAEGLAANRGDWTKAQATGFRNMESVTLAGVRSIMSAERALEEQRARASAQHQHQLQAETRAAERQAAMAHRVQGHEGHFDTSTLGGTVATAGAFAFEHAMHSVLERYQHFDSERRYARVVMGLTDQQQEPLVKQALQGGATSRFNDVQWVEAQREFAARGYGVDQVMAFTPIAAQIGTAFEKSLPEAVKMIEGAMLGFGADTSTFAKAVAAAQRTADLEVKTSKISGMNAEDIQQLYKYASAPARMAHLSEESMLAFGAISKKVNMAGDESGVAFRALAKNLLTPTAGAQLSMQAAGVDFSKFQRAPDHLDVGGFVDTIAKEFGIKLDAKATAALDKVFHDKDLMGHAAKFMPAVQDVLGDVLGGDDAKSKNKIAQKARGYRDASMESVDTNGLLTAIMGAIHKSPQLANSIFGSKQGGRIFAAMGDPKVFAEFMELITNHSKGFADKVATERNEGFNGAVLQLQGAVATLETSIGRAFDNGGNGGPLTEATSAASRFTAAMAEMNPSALRATIEMAGAAAVVAGLKSIDFIKGGFGLKEAGGEMMRAGDVQLQAGRLMLEAAAGHLPGTPGATPGGGPAKPAEAVPERTGIYDKPPPVEVPRGGGGVFSGGGFKGLAGGLAEGVIGAIVYDAGQNAIHAAEDHFLGFTKEDHDRIAGIDPGKDLMSHLDRWFGRVGDSTGPTDRYLGGGQAAISEQARRSAQDFSRDPESERGRRMMDLFGPMRLYGPNMPEEFGPPQPPPAAREPFGPPQPPPAVAPTVDLTPAEQGLMQLMSLSTDAGTHMQTALSVSASPTVNMAALDAFIAKVNEARAALASLGGMSPGAGPNASISPRRSFTPAPAGPRYSA